MTNGIDYGWVGDVTAVDPTVVRTLLAAGIIPLIASLGVDQTGLVYNVNADTVACAVAVSLQAERLMVMTAFDGVLRDIHDLNSRLPRLSLSTLGSPGHGLEISGGMLPKLASLGQVLSRGVADVRILSWHRPEVLSQLAQATGADVGTQITL